MNVPPVALITGASSGIGAALAEEYASRGFHTCILGRRQDRLEAIAARLTRGPVQCLPIGCDVTQDGDPERAVSAALGTFGRLDTVVANAGFGVTGPVRSLTIADYRRQFETNVFGVLRTVYATVDALIESRGKLAIIGSVNGFISLGGGSPYAMSKFAVRALADSLWYEMRKHGVSVTHIAPGFVESEIRSVDNHGVTHTGMRDPVPGWLVMPTAKAARHICTAIEKRKRERVITGHGTLIVFLQKHFTGLVNTIIGRAGIAARDEARPR